LYRTLQHIRSLGCRAGVTLNPGTSVDAIEPVLSLADLVLVMSVNPGFSGQVFIPEAVARVAELRRKLDALGSPAWLEVDGGITAHNLPQLRAAGATAFVSASAIFKQPGGIQSGIRALRAAK
jgi:ribulose-phosphate 3-epimerase